MASQPAEPPQYSQGLSVKDEASNLIKTLIKTKIQQLCHSYGAKLEEDHSPRLRILLEEIKKTSDEFNTAKQNLFNELEDVLPSLQVQPDFLDNMPSPFHGLDQVLSAVELLSTNFRVAAVSTTGAAFGHCDALRGSKRRHPDGLGTLQGDAHPKKTKLEGPNYDYSINPKSFSQYVGLIVPKSTFEPFRQDPELFNADAPSTCEDEGLAEVDTGGYKCGIDEPESEALPRRSLRRRPQPSYADMAKGLIQPQTVTSESHVKSLKTTSGVSFRSSGSEYNTCPALEAGKILQVDVGYIVTERLGVPASYRDSTARIAILSIAIHDLSRRCKYFFPGWITDIVDRFRSQGDRRAQWVLAGRLVRIWPVECTFLVISPRTQRIENIVKHAAREEIHAVRCAERQLAPIGMYQVCAVRRVQINILHLHRAPGRRLVQRRVPRVEVVPGVVGDVVGALRLVHPEQPHAAAGIRDRHADVAARDRVGPVGDPVRVDLAPQHPD
ncbi:hypothetical protein TruAng_004749 [Truncatella angustata]|nr:hypothetical protein TruAng_004749 [Truncatella angustata]